MAWAAVTPGASTHVPLCQAGSVSAYAGVLRFLGAPGAGTPLTAGEVHKVAYFFLPQFGTLWVYETQRPHGPELGFCVTAPLDGIVNSKFCLWVAESFHPYLAVVCSVLPRPVGCGLVRCA